MDYRNQKLKMLPSTPRSFYLPIDVAPYFRAAVRTEPEYLEQAVAVVYSTDDQGILAVPEGSEHRSLPLWVKGSGVLNFSRPPWTELE